MSRSQVQQNANQKEEHEMDDGGKRETQNCISIPLKHSSDDKYYFE